MSSEKDKKEAEMNGKKESIYCMHMKETESIQSNSLQIVVHYHLKRKFGGFKFLLHTNLPKVQDAQPELLT